MHERTGDDLTFLASKDYSVNVLLFYRLVFCFLFFLKKNDIKYIQLLLDKINK